MGVELELGVVLLIVILGGSIFAVFEVETPGWRKVVKWLFFLLVTLGLYRLARHWALIFPIAGALAGAAFHWWWCRKNGIDPIRATPRRRYYELRGWPWPDR